MCMLYNPYRINIIGVIKMERKVICIHPANKTKEDRKLAARKVYEILQRMAIREAEEQRNKDNTIS